MGSVIENKKTKEKCQIFTPDDIVKSMLDHLGYSDHLYGKTILESSCGNGQFLKEIVIRYIKDCESRGLSRTKIKNGLGRDIFGIELDPVRYQECIDVLDSITDKFSLKRVNWQIKQADNEYRDPRLLKDTIRNALNKAVGGKFFSDAQDSTSCLTAILYFEKSPDIKFKFDVAITTKNKNGNYMRLIHNKNVYALGLDQYTWNEVPNSHQVKDKADEIKEEGLWQEVRDRYLEKKNMYLSRQDRNHPSFVVYVEAVNEVYNRYFNRGGGYNVQSFF